MHPALAEPPGGRGRKCVSHDSGAAARPTRTSEYDLLSTVSTLSAMSAYPRRAFDGHATHAALEGLVRRGRYHHLDFLLGPLLLEHAHLGARAVGHKVRAGDNSPRRSWSSRGAHSPLRRRYATRASYPPPADGSTLLSSAHLLHADSALHRRRRRAAFRAVAACDGGAPLSAWHHRMRNGYFIRLAPLLARGRADWAGGRIHMSTSGGGEGSACLRLRL